MSNGMSTNITYITCHTPPIDIIIKEREEKDGLKK